MENGHRGWYIEIEDLIELFFPFSDRESVTIKISIDGARINNSNGKQIIGTIQFNPETQTRTTV